MIPFIWFDKNGDMHLIEYPGGPEEIIKADAIG